LAGSLIAEEALVRSIENSAAPAAASPQADIIRGSRAMAETLGLPVRAVDHLLVSGRLKTPRKIGGRWFASRSKLLREIVGD
jgi:hypothetical protein